MKVIGNQNLCKALLTLVMFISFNLIKAQDITFREQLSVLYIDKNTTLHFRSPEQINYIDISTDKLIGDIPIDNVAKIKCLSNDKLVDGAELGIVSIVGDSYLAQYQIIYKSTGEGVTTDVEINQEQMKPLQYPSVTMTKYEMRKMCLDLQKRPRKLRKTQSKGMGLSANLNNIYSYGDYIFLDVTFTNNTNIKYDIDGINFKIEDKKIYKATNSQSIEVYPVFSLYYNQYFLNTYRNIFVFQKFTFPNDKVFKLRLLEKQISGRTLELIIEYRDLLNSDTV